MSLLSVDDIVRAVYSVLTARDEWDNTVWLYTSDHVRPLFYSFSNCVLSV